MYQSVLNEPGFAKLKPFNAAYAASVSLLRDFYNIPQYEALLQSTQTNWHKAVTGELTPQQAMDAVAAEHEEILDEAKP